MTLPSYLRDRPLFICGHPKAGTSLLRAVFDSHPQLIVYPEESVFFRRFQPQAAGLDLEDQLELADRTLIHIFRWNSANPTPDQDDYPGRDYSAVSYEEVRSRMRQLAAQNYRHPGDILSAAVLAYGEVSGQTGPESCWWVEKSPYNEYYADQIFDWWPEAHCIHILRDPRDNFASYRRKHPDWTAEFFAANWIRSTQTGMLNSERFGPERYYLLRYEDLVRDPQTYLGELQKFLKIEWDSSLFAPTRAGEQWEGNSMFAESFDQVSGTPVGRWKEKLTPLEATVIEFKCAGLFKNCGYTPEASPNSGPFLQLAARWRLFTWPLRRRLQKRKTG